MKRRSLLAFLFCPAVARAHSYKVGAISIGHAWAMATSAAETSVMMPFVNNGAVDDSLVGARCDLAQSVELRDGQTVVSEFLLEPNKPFPMRAAAKHLQLLGLKRALSKGDVISMTLIFKSAGEAKIELHVNNHAGE